MEKKEWSELLSVSELVEPYAELAQKHGIAFALTCASEFGGQNLYFPDLERIERDKRIRKEFNGGNYKKLARKYGITERWIREIVHTPIAKNQITIDMICQSD